MTQEQRQNIALMRYSVIAPLITGIGDEYVSLEAFFRAASAKGVTTPDGVVRYFAPGTIENGTVITNCAALMHFSPQDVQIWENRVNWMVNFRNRSVI